MLHWKRAVTLGSVSWLIPFVLAFPLFSIKAHNAPLYNSLLQLIGLFTGAWLINVYFAGRRPGLREAFLVATLWTGMNLLFDQPFFLFGPMRMSAAQYWSEIGLGYFTLPIFAVGAARLAR